MANYFETVTCKNSNNERRLNNIQLCTNFYGAFFQFFSYFLYFKRDLATVARSIHNVRSLVLIFTRLNLLVFTIFSVRVPTPIGIHTFTAFGGSKCAPSTKDNPPVFCVYLFLLIYRYYRYFVTVTFRRTARKFICI